MHVEVYGQMEVDKENTATLKFQDLPNAKIHALGRSDILKIPDEVLNEGGRLSPQAIEAVEREWSSIEQASVKINNSENADLAALINLQIKRASLDQSLSEVDSSSLSNLQINKINETRAMLGAKSYETAVAVTKTTSSYTGGHSWLKRRHLDVITRGLDGTVAVSLTSDGSVRGSGFIVGSNLIITCAHVVGSLPRHAIKVHTDAKTDMHRVTSSFESYNIKSMTVDRERDLAYLVVSNISESAMTDLVRRKIILAEDYTRGGGEFTEQLFVFGHFAADETSFSVGVLFLPSLATQQDVVRIADIQASRYPAAQRGIILDQFKSTGSALYQSCGQDSWLCLSQAVEGRDPGEVYIHKPAMGMIVGATKGGSGGPVLNIDGKALGIYVGGANRANELIDFDFGKFEVAVPSESIRQSMVSNGINGE